MNVQYVTDDVGKITGVFIPISEWIDLTSRYKDINEDTNVPEFHKEIVRDRIEEYKKNQEIEIDFDEALMELKNE